MDVGLPLTLLLSHLSLILCLYLLITNGLVPPLMGHLPYFELAILARPKEYVLLLTVVDHFHLVSEVGHQIKQALTQLAWIPYPDIPQISSFTIGLHPWHDLELGQLLFILGALVWVDGLKLYRLDGALLIDQLYLDDFTKLGAAKETVPLRIKVYLLDVVWWILGLKVREVYHEGDGTPAVKNQNLTFSRCHYQSLHVLVIFEGLRWGILALDETKGGLLCQILCMDRSFLTRGVEDVPSLVDNHAFDALMDVVWIGMSDQLESLEEVAWLARTSRWSIFVFFDLLICILGV